MTNFDIAISKIRDIQSLLYKDSTSPNDVYVKYNAVIKYFNKGKDELTSILTTFSKINTKLEGDNNKIIKPILIHISSELSKINTYEKILSSNKENTISKHKSFKDLFQESNVLIKSLQTASKDVREYRNILNTKLQELSEKGALTDEYIYLFTRMDPSSEGTSFLKSL